ncbi:MAG: pantoate--beta-alanine ligase, partial [Chloroflexota bacterium]|nr:pantoate--beta-alanine ligase [Chloroflexota bacterium]
LEAAHRPTHFRGVTTVVTKLLQVAQADRSYFGMKDAQQLLVLTKLVRDVTIPTTVVPVPTVRAADGLALSSRNVHLDPEQRRAATAISRALDAAEARFDAGERHGDCLRDAARAVLAAEPLIDVQYVSCAALDTLEELDRVGETALVSIAAMVGDTHLIDNHWLGLPAGLAAPHADLGLLPPALRSDP